MGPMNSAKTPLSERTKDTTQRLAPKCDIKTNFAGTTPNASMGTSSGQHEKQQPELEIREPLTQDEQGLVVPILIVKVNPTKREKRRRWIQDTLLLPPPMQRPDPDLAAVSNLSLMRLAIGGDWDKFAWLAAFHTVFVIDDSRSMTRCDNLRVSRWKQVHTLLQIITPICTDRDSDGIDVYFLNKKSKEPALNTEGKPAGGYRNIMSLAQVNSLFDCVIPDGDTPIGATLQTILNLYTHHFVDMTADSYSEDAHPYNRRVKPQNIIVITDGVPTDDVESVIVRQAKRLDKAKAVSYQVGIQFFQIGDDRGAMELLRRLDDDIQKQHGVRDMVDTTTFDARGSQLTADGVLKAVLGGVKRGLDRMKLAIVDQGSEGSGELETEGTPEVR